MAEDVKTASEKFVCESYGVSAVTVFYWRQALGVGRITEGTRLLLQQNTGVPPEAAARGREKAKSAESRSKISASKLGKPVPPQTAQALLDSAKKKKPDGWGAKANKWMLNGKRQKFENE